MVGGHGTVPVPLNGSPTMKKILISQFFSASAVAFLAALSLAGCSSVYQIATFDGQTFKSRSVPHLDGGAYRFEGDDGKIVSLPYVRVKSLTRL